MLMNRTDSTPRRLILSAPSHELVSDLPHQGHADTIHILMVLRLIDRTNDSPSAHLEPIIKVPTHSPSASPLI